MPRLSRLPLAGKNHILYCRDYKKQNNNEVNISYFVIKQSMRARFGRNPPLSCQPDEKIKFAAIRSISNNLVFFYVYLTCLIFFVSNRKP